MKKPLLSLIICLTCSVTLFAQQDLLIKTTEKGPYLEHTVAAKEGLYSIGRFYNVHPKSIAAFNNIDLNKGLNIGQSIRIPLNDTNFNQKSAQGFPVYYIPAQGEGLMKVSNQNHKVTLANLRSWNKLNGDNIRAGEKLVVGYLLSKEFKPELLAKNIEPVTPVTGMVPELRETAAVEIKPELEESKPVVPGTQEQSTPVQPTETVTPVRQEEPRVNNTQAEPRTTQVTPAANAGSDIRPASEDGFFKTFFDQQIRVSPVSRDQTLTSGIFKTSSGWQDAKYYLLIDAVPTGTIVRLINPENNKAVYAKVLGEMNGIRQNQGLDIRISNAAASALGVREDEKFVIRASF